MVEASLDVVGIGSAIVDVISQADDDFLIRQGMVKGSMRLVESEGEADRLYSELGPAVEMSGGSCANTMAGIASLGGTGAFVGLVADDLLGKVFAHDIRSIGVEYTLAPAAAGPPTARCLVVVTPDAQRTMSTYLGAASLLRKEHIDASLIRRASVVYLEGYLWDVQSAKEAMVLAMELATSSGAKVAFTLSDGFCVDRHREEFLDLAENRVDILFANEQELLSLYQVDDFDAALQLVRGHCEIACLTRSEKGSVVVAGDEVHVIDAWPAGRVVDTTGAGDMYAAGFLYGYTHGFDLPTAARLASRVAAEVIQHVGARPEVDLAELAKDFLDRRG